jgi:plasmid stabilization system protein ParE
MARSFDLSEEAEHDLYDAARYIAENNIDAAERFLDSFNDTCALLVDLPEAGSLVHAALEELRELRMMRVENYPKHLIFYTPLQQKGIKVVRVIHAARDYTTFFEL